MVIDAAVLMDARGSAAHAQHNSHALTAYALPQQLETESDRAGRVRMLAELVRGGCYDVRAERLAMALLEWDPRRSSPRGSAETADRRRSYMREYMRKRRAGLAGVPAEADTAPSLSLYRRRR